MAGEMDGPIMAVNQVHRLPRVGL